MRIFVTGGTGFIGSHFLNLAAAEGHEMIAQRRHGSQPVIPLNHQPQWLEAELDEIAPTAMRGCDTLVHLAAAGVRNPVHASWESCLHTNVTAFSHLMATAIAAGIPNYVICGSCSEYGTAGERYERIPVDAPLEPTGAYHATKAAATMIALGLAKEHAIQLCILRPFHVFGEGESPDRLWPSLRQHALDGSDFPMTAGQQVRDFIPVESVAQAFLREATDPTATPAQPLIKNLGTGQPTTILEFAQSWWQHWGATGNLLPGQIAYRPNEVMRYVPEI